MIFNVYCITINFLYCKTLTMVAIIHPLPYSCVSFPHIVSTWYPLQIGLLYVLKYLKECKNSRKHQVNGLKHFPEGIFVKKRHLSNKLDRQPKNRPKLNCLGRTHVLRYYCQLYKTFTIPGRITLFFILQCVISMLVGTNLDYIFNIVDKDFSITNITCIKNPLDGVNKSLSWYFAYYYINLNLWQ